MNILIAQQEAKRRYDAGEKLKYSTGPDGLITFGYGKLDDYGFWEFPLRYNHLSPEQKQLVDCIDRRLFNNEQ